MRYAHIFRGDAQAECRQRRERYAADPPLRCCPPPRMRAAFFGEFFSPSRPTQRQRRLTISSVVLLRYSHADYADACSARFDYVTVDDFLRHIFDIRYFHC